MKTTLLLIICYSLIACSTTTTTHTGGKNPTYVTVTKSWDGAGISSVISTSSQFISGFFSKKGE